VTEARLALVPTPGKTLSGLLYFDDLDHVGRATQCILELSPSMVEIMERQILDLARNQIDELRPYIPDGIEGVLYVEFQEEDEESCRYKFRSVEKKIKRQEKLATDLRIAENHGDMAIFSRIRSISGPILNKIRGPKKPWAFIEDTAVHPTHLPEYIRGLRGLFQKYEVDFSIYGHAGDGNLHIMVFLDLRQAQEVEKMMALTDDCYDLVLRLNGTISAEHGDGRLRTYYLKKQYPNLYPAMVEIKELFDPDNILNPGCIVGARQNPLNRHLKFGDDYRVTRTGSTFDGEAARTEIETCSGCGKCRSYCPIAQQYQEEWAMGRGKTILLKEVISRRIDPKILDSPGFRKIVDSCINCKRCLEDCPSSVDIPWLAIAGRTHYLTKQGDSLGNRLITDTRLLCKTASVFGPLVNLANSWAPFRQCLESTIGLDRRRQLPLFQRKSLGGPAKGLDQPKGGKEIVYFASCFSDLNDRWPDGSATVEVLQHNGFRVIMPDFHCCGIARINAGSAQKAIEDIQCNVDMMRYYVEKGIKIVFDEPSCALAVKMEYPKILNSDLSKKVSENCYDIHQFLMTLYERDDLRLDLKEMRRTVGYHNPCHLRALGITREPVELLQLIPGVRVKVFSDRCCGLAGTFGMKKKNFDASMGIGSKLFKEIRDAGVEEIATSCAACKLQTRQGTGKAALDPISLLAEAYAR
jgi:anaerobic glycerol-3-phosphate dehydrogenase C subunit